MNYKKISRISPCHDLIFYPFLPSKFDMNVINTIHVYGNNFSTGDQLN